MPSSLFLYVLGGSSISKTCTAHVHVQVRQPFLTLCKLLAVNHYFTHPLGPGRGSFFLVVGILKATKKQNEVTVLIKFVNKNLLTGQIIDQKLMKVTYFHEIQVRVCACSKIVAM